MNLNFAGYAYSRNWGIGTALRQGGNVQCLALALYKSGSPGVPLILTYGRVTSSWRRDWLAPKPDCCKGPSLTVRSAPPPSRNPPVAI